jgi:AcrR family transcriptional regulator
MSSPKNVSPDVADGRRRRGDRTRRTIAAEAAALASLHGLSGLSIGQLAKSLGVSKSSVQAAFPTKEALQLAAIDAAAETFVNEVIVPAQASPRGRRRLHALACAWLDYVERRVFPGGCFMVATLAEFDSHPGAVRAALARNRSAWLTALAKEAKAAQAAGELESTPSAELIAFEVDALLSAANVERNLADDVAKLVSARQVIEHRLGLARNRRRT